MGRRRWRERERGEEGKERGKRERKRGRKEMGGRKRRGRGEEGGREVGGSVIGERGEGVTAEEDRSRWERGRRTGVKHVERESEREGERRRMERDWRECER